MLSPIVYQYFFIVISRRPFLSGGILFISICKSEYANEISYTSCHIGQLHERKPFAENLQKNLQCEKQLEYFTINCQIKEEYYIEDPSEHKFRETVSFTIGNFIFINIMHDCKG